MLRAPLPDLSTIRGRTLLAVFVLGLILPLMILEFAAPDLLAQDVPLVDALASLTGYLLVAAFLWVACLRSGTHLIIGVGQSPHDRRCGAMSFSPCLWFS
jgi:ABC-type transport system involved in cytochrome c biogenesis permease component